MSEESVTPSSYEQWRYCIEVRCKIRLTPGYIRERLTELQDEHQTRTKEFARLYGRAHLESTIAWFRRAGEEVANSPNGG